MGLMDKFNRQPSARPDILGVAKGIVGNDPRAALQLMADSGMTCNLPDGRTMPISDLMSMAEGKTPQQLLSALGIK